MNAIKNKTISTSAIIYSEVYLFILLCDFFYNCICSFSMRFVFFVNVNFVKITRRKCLNAECNRTFPRKMLTVVMHLYNNKTHKGGNVVRMPQPRSLDVALMCKDPYFCMVHQDLNRTWCSWVTCMARSTKKRA